MIIDESLFEEASLRKIVEKINDAHEKEKEGKILKQAQKLKKGFEEQEHLLEKVYIYSILAVEYPEVLAELDLETIKALLKNPNTKIKTNASVLLALYYSQDSERLAEPAEFAYCVKFLESRAESVRRNILGVLRELSADFNEQFLLHYPALFTAFCDETEEDNSENLLKLILKVEDYLPLSNQLENLKVLLPLLDKAQEKWKINDCLTLLRKIVPEVDHFLKKRPNTGRNNVLDLMKNRVPILKIYDMQEMAEEMGLSAEEVESQMGKIGVHKSVLSLFYTQKTKRYYVEVELHRFLDMIRGKKIDILSLYEKFKFYGITSSVLILIIQNILKEKQIRGYLSHTVFFSREFLENEITQKLSKEGRVKLSEYSVINREYLNGILEDVNRKRRLNGVFNNDRTEFVTFRGIEKDIERQITIVSTIDLLRYKNQLRLEDYLALEEHLKQEKLITVYNKSTVWLTPIGQTRILEKLTNEIQVLGLFDAKLLEKELEIPEEIIRDVALEEYNLSQRRGIWDNAEERFYFASYLKREMKKIETIKDSQRREDLISTMAEKLNINPREIETRMDKRVREIGKMILSEKSINMLEFQKKMEMGREEFIDYINRLEKPFLILGNHVILDEKEIEAARSKLVERFLNYAKAQNEIQMQRLSKIFKVSESIIQNICRDAIENEEIKGISLNEHLFLTKSGIIQRILDKRDFFSLHSLFPEKELSAEEIEYIEQIIEDLKRGEELSGEYDADQKIFQSKEATGLNVVNNAKERLIEMVDEYSVEFQLTFELLRAILMESGLRPSDIDTYRKQLRTITEQSVLWEKNLKKQIYVGNKMYKRYLKSITPDPNLKKHFGELEEVKQKMNEFQAWRTLIDAIENNGGEIIFLQKKLKSEPENEEYRQKLHDIFDYLTFFEE